LWSTNRMVLMLEMVARRACSIHWNAVGVHCMPTTKDYNGLALSLDDREVRGTRDTRAIYRRHWSAQIPRAHGAAGSVGDLDRPCTASHHVSMLTHEMISEDTCTGLSYCLLRVAVDE